MATKANEILAYSGDSALAGAGGLGKVGTEQTIKGVWNFVDSINASTALFKQQEFQKNRDLYQQKIKDRDEISNLINNNLLVTDQMEDADRLKIRDQINVLKKEFIDSAKKGISDEDYLNLKTKVAEITSLSLNAKTNYLTIQADEKMNNELYDNNSSVKTVQKSKVNKETGEQTTTSEQVKPENIRRSSLNQQNYQKHLAEQKELMKKDPFYKYKPFVPALGIDYDQVYPEIGVETTKKISEKNKYREITETKPSFDKTAEIYLDMWQDPAKRENLQKAYDQIYQGMQGPVLNPASLSIISNTNKKLEEINSSENDETKKLPFIDKNTNPITTMALINYAKKYDEVKSNGTKEQYIDKAAEEKDVAEFKSNLQIAETRETGRQQRLNTNATGNKEKEVELYKKQLDSIFGDGTKKSNNSNIIDSDILKAIYSERAKAINEADMPEEDKTNRLKELQDELFTTKVFANSENNGNIGNQMHNGTSSAMGTFGILKDSGHAKEAFEKSPLFENYKKQFGTYNKFYNHLASNMNEYNDNFTPLYLKWLELKAGPDIYNQLAFNYGGKRGLNEYKAGNLNYIPPHNKNTLRQHFINAGILDNTNSNNKENKKNTKPTAADLLKEVGL